MPFEIKITEVGRERRVIEKQWKAGAGEDGGYGYTPETEGVQEFERHVYLQWVEEMDLVAVIAAVNGINGVTLSAEPKE